MGSRSSSAPAFVPSDWNPNWNLGEVLYHLARIDPDAVKGLDMIARDCLRRGLRNQHRRRIKEWLDNAG